MAKFSDELVSLGLKVSGLLYVFISILFTSDIFRNTAFQMETVSSVCLPKETLSANIDLLSLL